ncbi:MAG: IS66 family transposase [Streptosporangiaceae bacterium]
MISREQQRDPADAVWWRGEADQLRAENAVLRAESAGQRERIADLEGQVAALAAKVAVLARLAFGKSTEKKSAKGPAAGDDGGGDGAGPGGGRAGRPRGQRPGSRGHGRRDYSHLPGREEVHDVPEDQRACPRCGAAYAPFGEESCEQIGWEVRLIRIVHRRPAYRRTCRCPVAGVIAAPPPPRAITGGRFTTGFLARLLVEKFVLARPAHRIAAALSFDGLEVAEGTLAGVFAALGGLLAPLAAAITERNAAAAHLHADESRWNVFAAVEGKDSHRWWLWVFAGPDTTVFRIAPSRSLAVLTGHLGIGASAGELPEGRALLLSSDFYSVYQSFGTLDGVDNLWCWAHIRRYFVRAGDAHPKLRPWADEWCERIGALYAAHAAMGAAEPGSGERRWAAAQFSAALNGINADRQAQARKPGLHRAAAKVLATLDREWEGLARHKEFPELPLDNNTAERAVRGPVVGRKNYYGSGSVASADLASAAWTITATAAMAQISPLAYLRDYLGACAQAGGRAPGGAALARFFPWAAAGTDLAAWRPGHPDMTGTAGGGLLAGTGPAP